MLLFLSAPEVTGPVGKKITRLGRSNHDSRFLKLQEYSFMIRKDILGNVTR